MAQPKPTAKPIASARDVKLVTSAIAGTMNTIDETRRPAVWKAATRKLQADAKSGVSQQAIRSESPGNAELREKQAAERMKAKAKEAKASKPKPAGKKRSAKRIPPAPTVPASPGLANGAHSGDSSGIA